MQVRESSLNMYQLPVFTASRCNSHASVENHIIKSKLEEEKNMW